MIKELTRDDERCEVKWRLLEMIAARLGKLMGVLKDQLKSIQEQQLNQQCVDRHLGDIKHLRLAFQMRKVEQAEAQPTKHKMFQVLYET